MYSFTYDSQIPRVIFGAGSLEHVGAEVDRIGARRVLLLATPEQSESAERVRLVLGERCVGVHARARMHVPRESVALAASEARGLDVDATVAFGGGSTIGLAKALALEHRLPIVAIPTTYAGSEMTPIHGITENGLKRTGREPVVLPRTVIYDPRLTVSLPIAGSVTSALNAIAHAVEALYAQDRNPLTSQQAISGIRCFARALPRVVMRPDDLAARSRCLQGAWLCGVVLGAVGMALHHKLCHTLGGSFGLPHAETHAVVLPHVLAYNAPAVPGVARRIARVLGAKDAAMGLYDFAVALGAPLALAKLGMRALDLEHAADLATRSPYFNPRPVDRTAIRALLDDAYHGRPPVNHLAVSETASEESA